MTNVKEYGFYTINSDYLKYLNQIDPEVYYNPSYKTSTKPFIGIILMVENTNYFVPITSAKEKHKKWKNVSDEHFIIYEIIDKSISIDGDIYKYYSEKEKMHLLAVLDIKKMIPVPEDQYERIEFNNLKDSRYRDLFRKEYAFCLSIKSKILKKVEKSWKNIYKTKRNWDYKKSKLQFFEAGRSNEKLEIKIKLHQSNTNSN